MPESDAPTRTAEALPKQYRPADHEPRIWSRWVEARAFEADPKRVLDGDAPPYCILMPPPNVTAALHLGHALNNTIQDILIRAHRMMGFETLWIPGADHAGIATQTVVDKRLQAEGKPALADYKKKELAGENGRDQFIALVQAWKDEYSAKIRAQSEAMGAGADWRRYRFTMDDVCARAVREAFFRLFRDGLIYRGKRLVNWDPVTQTALSDDEVEDKQIDGHFYYMKYPVVDDAGKETGGHVTVATTRPETYLGDTAVAVNKNDPERAAYIGKKVRLPLVGRVIEVIADDYVVIPDADSSDPKAQYASGFLKVTPAHDTNDWELGQRHSLDVINVMAPDATISDQHGWSDVGDAGLFVGLDRYEARKAVVAWFKENGLLDKTRPYSHSVGHSYRSHVPVEPYLSDQWYCKVTDDKLRGSAQRALVRDQRTSNSIKSWPASYPADTGAEGGDAAMTFYPSRYAKSYESWHDNLRDWCISRQLWWGHRIPVWSGSMVAWGDLLPEFEAKLAELRDQGRIAGQIGLDPEAEDFEIDATGSPAISTWESISVRSENDHEAIKVLEEFGFTQDPDVLDTWFSSGLWPLSTMGWPDASTASSLDPDAPDDFASLLPAFNPTSVLTTAREIITLWVSRMVMFNRYFLGQDDKLGAGAGRLPYDDVFIHAMIQDGEGRKMSKSLGNGVDPFDIIASHGADAMRFTLAKMTTQTQDVRMPVVHDPDTGTNTSPKFDEGRNFCNKLWNAARFTLSMLDKSPHDAGRTFTPSDLSLADRWMLSRLETGAREIADAIQTYQFSSYAQSMYDLLWRDFCDWYLEAIKPRVADDPGTRATLRIALDAILRLLHPITPFVTEAVHERLRDVPMPNIEGVGFASTKSSDTLCQSGWPELDASVRDEAAETEFERVRSLVRTINETRAAHQVEPRRRVTLHISDTLAASVSANNTLVETLAGLSRITTDAPPESAAVFTFEAGEHHLSDLADAVDAGAERERLEKQIQDLSKSIGALEGRLSNPGYVDKAPEKLVNQTREQLEQTRAELATVEAALEKI